MSKTKRYRAQGLAVVLGGLPCASDFAQILANVRRYPAWAPPG
jgi:hypothetical protein